MTLFHHLSLKYQLMHYLNDWMLLYKNGNVSTKIYEKDYQHPYVHLSL